MKQTAPTAHPAPTRHDHDDDPNCGLSTSPCPLTTSRPVPSGQRDQDHGTRLVLMGGLSLVCDGHPVAVPMRSQKVLAFVALRGRPTPRLHVAGALWINASESRAMASLRSALWQLGQSGFSPVQCDGDYLSLRT